LPHESSHSRATTYPIVLSSLYSYPPTPLLSPVTVNVPSFNAYDSLSLSLIHSATLLSLLSHFSSPTVFPLFLSLSPGHCHPSLFPAYVACPLKDDLRLNFVPPLLTSDAVVLLTQLDFWLLVPLAMT
jgi:hypothetical protein